MGIIIILNLLVWVLSILFVIWFITSVNDFLRVQRKKMQIFEKMLESQKETNRVLSLIASNQRENE
jgi:preprotein translocase subunit YajC